MIVHFLEKANVKESKWFYALYLDVAGEEQEMQHNWLLSDFPLPSPARLELRKKPRKPMKWFGTDPSTLPMLVDPRMIRFYYYFYYFFEILTFFFLYVI